MMFSLARAVSGWVSLQHSSVCALGVNPAVKHLSYPLPGAITMSQGLRGLDWHQDAEDRNFTSLLAFGVKFFLSQLSTFEQGYCKVEGMQFAELAPGICRFKRCPGNEPFCNTSVILMGDTKGDTLKSCFCVCELWTFISRLTRHLNWNRVRSYISALNTGVIFGQITHHCTSPHYTYSILMRLQQNPPY